MAHTRPAPSPSTSRARRAPAWTAPTSNSSPVSTAARVAGVIKFFDSPQFTEERCPCSFLYSGRLKGSTLTFDFRQPDDDDQDEDVWLRAVLQLIPAEEPLLTGDVYLIDPDENLRCGALVLDGQPRQGLSDELKRCNPDEPGTWTPESGDDTLGGEESDA